MTSTTQHDFGVGGAEVARQPSASLAGLLPARIPMFETHDLAPLISLAPGESAFLTSGVRKRALEFATGRWCARKVLHQLGVDNFPLLSDVNRAPLWPSGIVGSITHVEGFCAVAAGRQDEFIGIGIDAELNGAVEAELWTSLFTPPEIAWLDQLPARHRASMATVLFSAKESFYKAQYSLTKAWLDFTAATVRIEGGRWTVTLLHPCGPLSQIQQPMNGRFLVRGPHVVTAIALRASTKSMN